MNADRDHAELAEALDALATIVTITARALAQFDQAQYFQGLLEAVADEWSDRNRNASPRVRDLVLETVNRILKDAKGQPN